MEADELQLVIAYADLGANIAFRDFLEFQRTECERLELAALNADATDFERARTTLIQWQQRRLVMRQLEETVRDSANALKSIELETNDARPDPARSDRTGW